MLVTISDALFESIDLSPYEGLSKDLSRGAWWMNALSFLVAAPFIEELLFRLPILKHNYYFLIPSLLLLLGVGGYLVTEQFGFIFILGYSTYLFLAYRFYKERDSFPKSVVVVNMIISSIVFGVLHLYNFNFEEVALDVSGILFCVRSFTPLIFAGLGFALIRLRLSVYWSMIAHSMYNFMPFIAITFL
jgi:membrane protease YdiL (CAAX protease family)